MGYVKNLHHIPFPFSGCLPFSSFSGMLPVRQGGVSMKTAIVACRTLERELTDILNRKGCPWPVYWLEAGAHNHPQKRRQEILEALEKCREYDRVLLAMAYCGGSLEGVKSDTSTLVLPYCDDCISLLLGDHRQTDHYYLTHGWLVGKDNIHQEYRRSLERYGKATTERIFRSMLKNYRYLAYIPYPGEDEEELSVRLDQIAADLGLEPVILESNTTWLEALITENHSPDRFRILPPGVPITREI